ncbi:MBL fold metallo-hydrolase [Stutzerimonas stutzeri]|uniref:MBL fold metallo-hydrolase n=1 Tax=Stutzerimonas stutzeri TaxID=316 RepID=A0A6I6LN59_STUST|nr:MBL fold metallo-hydrolase [Stutzerimonas stutzeri]QGZ30217.1 MBL fold metallo-hydrolase [Stutzerimonas stutzeri]
MRIDVHSFFDAITGTFSHLVHSPDQRQCAVIDAVLGFDPANGHTDTRLADEIAAHIQTRGLQLEWLLETHVHADHLSGASYLRDRLGGRIGISEKVRDVCAALADRYGPFVTEPYDYLFGDDEALRIGDLSVRALAVPGHTVADIAYEIDRQMVFVGDTLFAPDVGTARCDFPGGNAKILYRSIRRLLALPPDTRLFMCHDYPPSDRRPLAECSVAEQRALNIHVHDGISEEAFEVMRKARDATLAAPRLLVPSIRANLGAASPYRPME